MREIRFRAWEDIGTKGTFRMNYDVGVLPTTNPNEWQENSYLAINPAKSSVILMQFTGLKDKNGKEIYEGDIYRDKRGQDFVIRDFVEDTFNLNTYFAIGGNVSVIGNIYENGDLLK